MEMPNLCHFQSLFSGYSINPHKKILIAKNPDLEVCFVKNLLKNYLIVTKKIVGMSLEDVNFQM